MPPTIDIPKWLKFFSITGLLFFTPSSVAKIARCCGGEKESVDGNLTSCISSLAVCPIYPNKDYFPALQSSHTKAWSLTEQKIKSAKQPMELAMGLESELKRKGVSSVDTMADNKQLRAPRLHPKKDSVSQSFKERIRKVNDFAPIANLLIGRMENDDVFTILEKKLREVHRLTVNSEVTSDEFVRQKMVVFQKIVCVEFDAGWQELSQKILAEERAASYILYSNRLISGCVNGIKSGLLGQYDPHELVSKTIIGTKGINDPVTLGRAIANKVLVSWERELPTMQGWKSLVSLGWLFSSLCMIVMTLFSIKTFFGFKKPTKKSDDPAVSVDSLRKSQKKPSTQKQSLSPSATFFAANLSSLSSSGADAFKSDKGASTELPSVITKSIAETGEQAAAAGSDMYVKKKKDVEVSAQEAEEFMRITNKHAALYAQLLELVSSLGKITVQFGGADSKLDGASLSLKIQIDQVLAGIKTKISVFENTKRKNNHELFGEINQMEKLFPELKKLRKQANELVVKAQSLSDTCSKPQVQGSKGKGKMQEDICSTDLGDTAQSVQISLSPLPLRAPASTSTQQILPPQARTYGSPSITSAPPVAHLPKTSAPLHQLSRTLPLTPGSLLQLGEAAGNSVNGRVAKLPQEATYPVTTSTTVVAVIPAIGPSSSLPTPPYEFSHAYSLFAGENIFDSVRSGLGVNSK